MAPIRMTQKRDANGASVLVPNIAALKVNVTINGVTCDVPYVTLLAWRGALRLECVGLRHSKQNASTVIRRMFNLPRSHRKEQMLEGIAAMCKDVADTLANA